MPLLHIDVPPGWTVVAGRQQVHAVMLAAGGEVAAKARAMIRSGSRKGPSKPGEPPHSVSGKLARSIRARAWKDGEGVTVRASEFYALFLSLGAKGGGGNTADKGNMVMERITRRGADERAKGRRVSARDRASDEARRGVEKARVAAEAVSRSSARCRDR